ELDRLAREVLPQIEPNLADARRPMPADPKTDPKSDPKTDPKGKSPLDKAQKLQEQAKKGLDDLAKFLDPWASMHQVKGETRELLHKQKDLRSQVEKLVDKSKSGDDQAKSDDDLRAELQRRGEAQKELEERAKKLMAMMESSEKKRAEQ